MESNIEKMVARAEDPDGPFYTIKQVAEQVGVSKDTIRRWGKLLGLPSHRMPLSEAPNAFVWCYTESDIIELSAWKNNKKTA